MLGCAGGRERSMHSAKALVTRFHALHPRAHTLLRELE